MKFWNFFFFFSFPFNDINCCLVLLSNYPHRSPIQLPLSSEFIKFRSYFFIFLNKKLISFHLCLQSGKVYIQRSQTPDSPLNSDSKHHQMTNQTESKFQDLNFPPSPSKRTLNLFNETSLDLKLTSSPSPSPSPSTNYASVCTLDKVKSALERADKELVKKRSSLWKSTSSPSSYSSSSSAAAKEIQEEEEAVENRNETAAPMAVGCRGCLSYVLVTKNNPRCPRCNSVVPLASMKKPRIDLNMSI